MILSVFFTCLGISSVGNFFVHSDYFDSLIDKETRAETLVGPKLIFAGGSNLAFGINSERIQNDLNLPCVNMGVNAGLGLKFVLDEAERVSKKGDIILLCPEYTMPIDGNPDLTEQAVSALPRIYNGFSVKEKIAFQYQRVLHTLSFERTQNIFWWLVKGDYKKFISKDDPTFVYLRSGFNQFGDEVSHCIKKTDNLYSGDTTTVTFGYDKARIDLINQFSLREKQQGVQVYYMPPCFPRDKFINDPDSIVAIDRSLRKALLPEEIGSESDFLYPDSLFYNTLYHLNCTGREERTEKLLSFLKSQLHYTSKR